MTQQEYVERLHLSALARIIEKYTRRELSATEAMVLVREELKDEL